MHLSYWEIKNWFSAVDYTIVGSGIVGLHAALRLRERFPESKILVLEKGMLPQGASTKNAGFACFGSMSEIIDDLSSQSEEEVIQLISKRWKGLQMLRKRLGDSAIDFKPYGGYELFLKIKLEEIILFLSRKYTHISIPKAKSLVRIGKAVQFIETNFHNNIYIQQLAELSFMSVRNFQRIFKEATGSSPNGYLLELRIQHASKLLIETESAIYSVSEQVGITDWFYFSKAFKKKFGVSPLAYRKQNKLV